MRLTMLKMSRKIWKNIQWILIWTRISSPWARVDLDLLLLSNCVPYVVAREGVGDDIGQAYKALK